jgi:signal transduction histidine kinase
MPAEHSSGNPSGVSSPRRYVAAVAAAISALLLRQLLAPLLGESNPYHTVWAAVVFSAWYCGLWPSIIATLLSFMGVWYWFIPFDTSFTMKDPKNAIAGMVGFLFFSGLIIALGEANRSAAAKSKYAEEQLKAAHDELERKVQERTEDLKLATESLRELSSRLQQMRDDERRRIASELHDSIGQLLAALSMNLAAVQGQAGRSNTTESRALSECVQIAEQISREIRTISHLLHPPLLDAVGLASALRWYVDEFSDRSKIKVNLDIPEALNRLSDDMEIAIFRMVQECLTNIHRHSGSTSAAIMVRQNHREIFIAVSDQGRGIEPQKQLQVNSSGRTGVGFRGMRERLRHLGGSLEIKSDTSGTIVSATVPLSPEITAASPTSETI